MKKLLLLTIAILCTLVASAQSARVVINSEGDELRYLGQTKTKYHVSAQDDYWISKKGCTLVTYSAAKGQGVVYPKTYGPKTVFARPSFKSKRIETIGTPEGDILDYYYVLGTVKGWYKIRTKYGKVGYVRASLFSWDPLGY